MEGDSAEPIDIDADRFAAQEAAAKSKDELDQGRKKGGFAQMTGGGCLGPGQPVQCMVECIRGGKGVCRKLLNSLTPPVGSRLGGGGAVKDKHC